jgi:drug/metabolite transporter (DMT)-like permease
MAGVLLGTLGVFVQEAQMDSLSVVFWRCLIGALALALVLAFSGPAAWKLPSTRALVLAALTGVLMVGNWVLFFEAIKRTGIAVATISFHVQPVLVLLLGAAFFGASLKLRDLGWVLVALAGLALAIGLSDAHIDLTRNYLVGIASSLAGALLYAWVTLIARSLKNVGPYLLTLIQCAVGVPLLALLGPATPGGIGSAQWGWLLGLGLIHTCLVYVLIYDAMPRLATPLVAMLLFVYPASAVIVDFFVYGKLISFLQGLGFAAILIAGLAVADLLPKKKTAAS